MGIKDGSEKKTTRHSGCFRCGEEGHFARECPKFPDDGGNKRPRDSQRFENKIRKQAERFTEDEDIARAARRRDAEDGARVGLEKTRMRKPEGLGFKSSGGDGLRFDDRRLMASAAREANAFESDGSFFAKSSGGAFGGSVEKSTEPATGPPGPGQGPGPGPAETKEGSD